VVTGAGRLRSRYVIHAATMGPDLCTDGEKIYRATLSALREAAALGLETVAFPALGTGVGGFGYAQAAQVMLKAIQEHASKYTHPEKVVLVLFGQEAYRAFRQEWERMRGKDG
jgi:O-acetyl-ADP-ribose deacetylase (regulator of RNase III)